MENRKIMLWKKPPYIEFSAEKFEASLKEFKVNDKKSAMIVCPGGAYACKAEHEGDPIAEMLNDGGINAYVLDYNVAPCHKFAPLSDIQRAIRTLRSMGYEKVGTLGFSAGGHLCCTSATMYDFEAYKKTDDVDNFSARPDAFVPCYPVVTMDKKYTHMGSRQFLLGDEWENEELAELFSNEKHVTKNTPPCFLWHTATDDAVPVQNSIMLANALIENNVEVEMHIYSHGCHGLGLAKEFNDISTWTQNCVIFLKNRGF